MAGPEIVLNVAEKNDAAKELSKVMCRGYPRMVSDFATCTSQKYKRLYRVKRGNLERF